MAEFSMIELASTILKLVKFSGFSTFTVENGKAVLKCVDILCFTFSLFLGISISVLSLLSLNFDHEAKDAIVLVGNQIASNLTIFVAIISMCFAFVARDKNWDIIVQLHQIDLKVFDDISENI